MKKIKTTLLFLTLMLGACSSNSTTPESASTQNPAATDITLSSDSVATEAIETEAVVPAREAALSEIENTVTARTISTNEAAPASNGLIIFETGSVETGANSRARLDLNPDGTIIRVGPNSSFILTTLTKENDEPKTKLELLFGQVFILLNGGSLDVQTPSGVASVRGSLMSVTYSPGQNRTTTTCLEGHCVVEDDDEEIELTEGQAADFVDGELDDAYRDMTFEELGLWILDNPDINEYMEEIPDLPDLPEDFDWDYDFTSDPEFEFFFDPEYDPGEQIIDPEFEVPTDIDLPLPDPDATFEPGIDPPGDGDPPGPGNPPGDGDPPGPG